MARMNQKREPAIIISSFYHLSDVIEQAGAIVSILGKSDKLPFLDVGSRSVLPMAFDDVDHTSSHTPATPRTIFGPRPNPDFQ